MEIAKLFNATHASVKRWFNFYKILVKPRTLSCGRNPASIKNLELGKTPEAERKSAEARKIYTKEKLIQIIKSFVEKHGRVPTKNEFVKIRNSSYPNHSSLRVIILVVGITLLERQATNQMSNGLLQQKQEICMLRMDTGVIQYQK
ncbi:MAG: hypothetical protein FJZ07_02655 [Candidatus Nealsonbacteria bacterium]|nr:hypothetical protein [Candidatus Nealsonbacteria bacterium]